MADEFRIDTGDEETEAQAAPTPYKEQNTPGPVARGLSQVLMQGAFEKFGHAFTDTGDVARDSANEGSRMAPWRAQGAKTANALETRWHTMEYENFQASSIEPYIEQKKMMLERYKQLHADLDSGLWAGPPGPDGQPQTTQLDVTKVADREQIVRLRGQLEKDFYGRNADMDVELFGMAHKYPNNPMIGERIQMIAKSYSDQLLTATNPQQSLQAEGDTSVITARMMEAETNARNSRASAKAKALKEPTGLRQVRAHPDIGPAGAMQWMVGSAEGEAFLYGNRGGDSIRDATNYYEQQLIKEDSSLEKDPDKLAAKLQQMQGRIRNLAASMILKEQAPDMLAASKEATPWFFDFEQKGVKRDGILNEDDERGYKGERRLSTERKKELFEGWVEQWDAELDEWASKPEHELTPEAAMDHMKEWVKDAIVNGAPGVPNNITIAINSATKDVREELIDALVSSGARNLMKNHYMAEANPVAGILEKVAHPFGGKSKRRSGRRYRGRTPRPKGLNLGE